MSSLGVRRIFTCFTRYVITLLRFVWPNRFGSMNKFMNPDTYTEKKYALNNFDPVHEDTKYSYTSGRVLKPHYNQYKKSIHFQVNGYFTDWSQYDGRYESQYQDASCGRGINLMDIDARAYDKIIFSFLGIVGDHGAKAATVAAAAAIMHEGPDAMTILDPWGDLAAYRNCGFPHYKSENYLELFDESQAQGALGGVLLLKKKNPALKLSVCVGGWTLSEPFHTLAGNPARRTAFCDSVHRFFTKFPAFDEIDIDWEYPNAAAEPHTKYGPEDTINFPVLVAQLVQRLSDLPKKIKISVAISADPDKIAKADVPALVKSGVWGFNVMTYDFFGTPWAPKLAHHTNLRQTVGNNGWSVEKAVNTLLDQYHIPSKQIFIGYAGYARNAKNASISSFSPLDGTYRAESTTIGTFESGTTEWYDILQNYLDMDGKAGKNKFVLYTDDVADADYLYSPESKVFMSFDTPRTVFNKGQYVQEKNLGGLFTWIIEYDRGLLVNAAREGLGDEIVEEVIDMKDFYFKGRSK